MTSDTDANPTSKLTWTVGGRRMRGVLIVAMGCLAMASPLFAGPLAVTVVGLLVIACGLLELLDTFRFPDEAGQRSAYTSGVLSIGVGVVALNMPKLVLGGLELIFAGSFLLDAVSKASAAWKAWLAKTAWRSTLLAAVVNAALGVVLLTGWPISGMMVVEMLVGVHMLASGWGMMLGRPPVTPEPPDPALHPDYGLHLPAHAEFARLDASLKVEEDNRRIVDLYWCGTFVGLFFAIHLGRMNLDWNLVGFISPLVAVMGDLLTALVIAFGLILPCRLTWRRFTRPLERRGWKRRLTRIDQGQKTGLVGWLSQAWLMHRLRFARRFAQLRRSPWAAVRWGMQVGLPATAVLIAITPMWGISWFFNSESWATGVWDRWAEVRTDTWRENMIAAVQAEYRDKAIPAERLFQIEPAGVAGSDDFTFLVLGDTGEGGGAQHALRDQYLFLGKRPDVKFAVISSDVIYPAGAMRDYEPKFYLPFKGFTKPIYAIPGNHDWYDALEGFAANFLEKDAARATMRSRVDTDGRLTTTTEGRIDRYIAEAARLRKEFGVSTGWQRGPFFELQTDRFALIAVDTGVLKTVDNAQWDWLKAALARAKGKSVLAILGHPLYVGGRYKGGDALASAGELIGGPHVEPFVAIHRLLKEHQVDIVMAGDTHYFEHYLEKYDTPDGPRTMQHFVNGGGGAYISIGTPLDWPRKPAVPDCAFFPRTEEVVAKLDRDTPLWKMPIWLWAKHLRAWPATVETTAAAFDYSRAPFFQSFVEVRVEGTSNRVRLIPHSANGPLRWRDLQTFGAIMPDDKTGDDFVEHVLPLPKGR